MKARGRLKLLDPGRTPGAVVVGLPGQLKANATPRRTETSPRTDL